MVESGVGDLAEFAELALVRGLIGRAAVVAWGDEVILASEVAPVWAIELATAAGHPDEVAARLRAVPGERTEDWLRLFLGLAARRWFAGELEVDAAVSIGWYLYLSNDVAWGYEADLEYFAEGGRVREVIDEALRPFREYESALPGWVEVRG